MLLHHQVLDMDSKRTKSKAYMGENIEGVEVQQGIIYIDTGTWKSKEVSHYSVGQQF